MVKQLVVISFSFNRGGAAIAANKFKSICEGFENMEVIGISQDDANYIQLIKRIVSFVLLKLQNDRNPIKHSLNLFSFPPARENLIENHSAVHHVHWINNDTLSVFDFDLIPSGSIITLHDEWLYCGAEHVYRIDDESLDFVTGYKPFKKNLLGLHLNYWLWKIKFKKLASRSDLIYTVPSSWLKQRAESSAILRGKDIRVLPNPIDTIVFSSSSKSDIQTFRSENGISSDDFVFCFGAIKGKNNFLKGPHLLQEAMQKLASKLQAGDIGRIKFIDFGGDVKESSSLFGFETISFGHVADPHELALLYSSADCVVLPSLVESFGQVAAEALACETPVVSFNTSGLRDIVINQQTGLLAKSFCSESMAEQLFKMFKVSKQCRIELGVNGRNHIVDNFSLPVVAKLYKEIIDDAILSKGAG